MNITMNDGRVISLDSYDVQRSYAGQMEGRPGTEMNNFIIESLRRDSSIHVILPQLDLSEPKWPKLPRYQVRCMLRCHQETPDSEFGTYLGVAFFCDDVATKPMPEIIEETVRDLDWAELASEWIF